MAVNKPIGNNTRVGAVKERSQTFNPKTELFVKRNTVTGEFMQNKVTGGTFKGVRREKNK